MVQFPMKYRYDKGAHAIYSIQFHLVFCVKYRKAVLVGSVASRLKEIVPRIADSFEIELRLRWLGRLRCAG